MTHPDVGHAPHRPPADARPEQEPDHRLPPERALIESEARFALLVHSVRDYGIFLLDPTGNVSSWNEGAERIKGYAAREIVGQHFSRFYPPEDLAWDKPAFELREATEHGRFEDEGWRLRKDGSRFWANVVITALRNSSGELVGFAKVTRDLTERREATERAIESARRLAAEEAARDAAEARARELADLLDHAQRQAQELERQRAAAERLASELAATTYSIAHDLRSPLRALDGYSALLMLDHSRELGSDARLLLERIRLASQRMSKLIDGILSLARLGRSEIEIDDVDLSSLARTVVSDLQRAEPDRAPTVIVQPHLTTRGDPRLLLLVIQNLINNAWKFSRPAASPRIEVGSLDGEGERVFFVRDNGVGFEMEFSHKLFNAFERLHGEDEFEGTGIGLATVKRIVERHGGRVWAESSPGEGATFYFTIAR